MGCALLHVFIFWEASDSTGVLLQSGWAAASRCPPRGAAGAPVGKGGSARQFYSVSVSGDPSTERRVLMFSEEMKEPVSLWLPGPLTAFGWCPNCKVDERYSTPCTDESEDDEGQT